MMFMEVWLLKEACERSFKMTKKPQLTTSAGAPVVSNETTKTAGERGPALLQDYQLIEK